MHPLQTELLPENNPSSLAKLTQQRFNESPQAVRETLSSPPAVEEEAPECSHLQLRAENHF